LVRGESENVRKAAARIDYRFSGFLGLGYGGVGFYLRSANGGYVRAGAGKGGVECAVGP